MKYKELTPADIDYMYRIYKDKDTSWDDRMRQLMEFTNKSERTVRKWCSKLDFGERDEPIPEQFEMAQQREYDPNKKRYLITWGQANTPVHTPFFNNMLAYADHIGAEVHVIAGRYKNPTSKKAERKVKEEELWAQELVPYLDAKRHNIHKYLSILSDIKIQPTAARPMSGMAAVSGEDSCIFGAPKVHLEMIPVLEGRNPKMMMTTGACTKKNYTDTKAGKKGEFHHTFGFITVEIEDDDYFYVRQVTANTDGSFTDLYHKVKNGNVQVVDKIAAIILGDIHLGETNDKLIDITFNQLCKKLKPKHIVLHDIFNGHSISHHEEKDPFKLYEREVDGTNSLKLEIDNMIKWLKPLEDQNVTIVRSNHDDFVDRWLTRVDWKKQPKNMLEYMEYATAILKGNAPKGVVPYIIDKHYPKFNTLARSSSFQVLGWELGHHGDYGVHGSRGSLLQYRRLNTKCVIGHSHQPGRFDGALSVGTSTHLRLDYNKGASGWLNSHVIIHEDGKAQHINFIGNELKYTTFK